MTCKQTNINAEFLQKINEGFDSIIIKQCSVCKRIDLGDGALYEYDFFKEYVNIQNPYKVSHVPCSPECLSQGYGIDYIKAKRLMEGEK